MGKPIMNMYNMETVVPDMRFEVFMALKKEFIVVWAVVTSTLKMDAAQYSEIVSNHNTIWHNNPEKHEFY
jgi:hypothetical protein